MNKKKELKIAFIIIGIVLAIGIAIGVIFFLINNNETNQYTVTFVGENNEVLKLEEVEKNALVEQWDPERIDGFLGWFTKDDEPFDFSSKITSDTTLYAKWYDGESTIVSYLVTFLVDDEVYQTLEVPENDTLEEEQDNPTKEGYTFVGWYENDVPFDFSTPITEEHTLVAIFEPNN